ncbi:30S ribosomal protein S1 [Tundrisphaera lichenicola]|uniref:30S ribosomal protein S1 n=1 Tax=Tundrisphaera lichenicola TaxID=2029860 RepID=UPI003EBCC008
MSDERDRRPSEQDAAIDAALDAAAVGGPSKSTQELNFKRHWDSDLDAELEAAMAGFDDSALEVNSPGRLPRGERAGGMAPSGGRGQESRQGPQIGKVISIRGKTVFIDLGAKSEGVIPVEQFAGNLPSPGDEIEVRVDHFDTAEGLLILALKGAAVEANWENLRKGLIVEAKVTKTNKGGLDVEVDGIRGFLPIGQIDINRVEDASIYVGQKLRVVVTEARQSEKNLVVSRRELLEKEKAEKREETWKTLEEGQVHKGVVRSLKPFGAFVEFGGVDGLIHVGDMSWARVADPSSLLKMGDEVEVKVLKIDRVTEKVGLGLKQLMPSPWDLIDDKYHRGQMVNGKVTRLMDFGAFVELEPGIEGLIHISELSPTRVRRVVDIVKPEQEVEVRILKVDTDEKKIALSLIPLPAATVVEAEEEEEEDDEPRPPKPEPKIPLKGGLGDRDPFLQLPKGKS